MAGPAHANRPGAHLLWFPIDTWPLEEAHLDEPGFYVAACGGQPTEPWSGAVLYRSSLRDSGYERLASFDSEAFVGLCSVPPSTSISGSGIDTASRVRVKMQVRGVNLDNCSVDDMLGGKNRALIGGELVGWAVSDLVSIDGDDCRTFDLSTMLRGLHGTEGEIVGHVEDSNSLRSFVQLDSGGLHWVPQNSTGVGQTWYYKLVKGGASLVRAIPRRWTYEGNNLRPAAPHDVVAERDGDGNLAISWQRRSRRITRFLGPEVDDLSTSWAVEIVDPGAPTDVVRTLGVLGERRAGYSAVQHVHDGYVPMASVDVKVSERSPFFFETPKAEVTV